MRDAFGVQTEARYSGIIESDGLPTREKLKTHRPHSAGGSVHRPTPDDEERSVARGRPAEELYGQNVVVAVFGMGERALPEAARLVSALGEAAARAGLDPTGASTSFAAPPPWGELAMTPREAYLGSQEAVPRRRRGGQDRSRVAGDVSPGNPQRAPR